MAQQTEIYVAKLGGPTATMNKMLVGATAPGEQIEVTLTKRTDGQVRVALGESNVQGGIGLPLDEPVMIRLGEEQRLWLVTDEIVDQQSVDIVKQPVSSPAEQLAMLDAIRQRLPLLFPEQEMYCPPKIRPRR